jgi:conjugative transfer signal peptidase TraF
MLRPVVAVAGDMVTVTAEGITVNGHPVPGSAPLDRDSSGRQLQPVPLGSYRLAPGQIWLSSGHDPRSFDSRYFGPVPVASVRGIASPVLVR